MPKFTQVQQVAEPRLELRSCGFKSGVLSIIPHCLYFLFQFSIFFLAPAESSSIPHNSFPFLYPQLTFFSLLVFQAPGSCNNLITSPPPKKTQTTMRSRAIITHIYCSLRMFLVVVDIGRRRKGSDQVNAVNAFRMFKWHLLGVRAEFSLEKFQQKLEVQHS